jgi:hypothetical protein
VNRKREGVVSIDGGEPVEVTYDAPFQRSPVVVPGLLAGSSAVRVEVSTVTATTCELEAFSAAGVSVAATVHWHAMGP